MGKLVDEDGTPMQPMTADGLQEMLKSGGGAIPTPADAVPQPSGASKIPEAPTGFPSAPKPTTPAENTKAPTETPASESVGQPSMRFGPPRNPPSTEEILGYKLVAPPTPPPPPPAVTAAPPAPEDAGDRPQKHVTDNLEQARGAATKADRKSKSDHAMSRLLADYPSTRMVHVRLSWRNPVSRSYHKKGRVKNVSINDVRDPDSWCEGPDGSIYGGDWVMGYMPADAGKHIDDSKAWYDFDFQRDGPEPPYEWTIDQPRIERLTVEVEGMGQISIKDLTTLMSTSVAEGLKSVISGVGGPPQQQTITIPVQGAPHVQQGHPGYPGHGGYPPPYYPPPPDPEAKAREERLEKQLEESRRQHDALMKALNDKDKAAAEAQARLEREAADARHRAELEALKSGFQSSIDKTSSVLEAVVSKLNAVEQKANQPPPAPPAPPPRDEFAALSTLKEILVGGRSAEAEAAKAREAALAEERRRDQDERTRRLEEERADRERTREEARDRRDREREEDRQRREDDRARREAADRDAQRTFEQYRMMGESALNNARVVAEISAKQNDSSPTIAIANAMMNQTVQSAQIIGTLFKNFGQGGGGGGGTNWPELIAQLAPGAFQAISDIGAAWAESSTNKAKIAAQQQTVVLPPPVPSPAPQPRTPPMAGMNPQATPAAPTPAPQPSQTQPPAPTNPLMAYVNMVNADIAARKPPKDVAERFDALLHAADTFGMDGLPKRVTAGIRSLKENPLSFLKKAYPSSDPAYLKAIADILTADDDEHGDEDDEGKNRAEAPDTEPTPEPQEAAPESPPEAPPAPTPEPAPEPQEAAPAPPAPAPEPAASTPAASTEPVAEPHEPTAEEKMLAAMQAQHARPVEPHHGPTEAEMLAAMQSQANGQPAPSPRRVRVAVTDKDGNRHEIPTTDVQVNADSDNGKRRRGGGRRKRTVPVPTTDGSMPKPETAPTEGAPSTS